MADTKNPDNKNRKIREQHNRELIRRMHNGESLTTYDSKASWYPPRPIIAKDEKEMVRVYGNFASAPSNAAEKRLTQEEADLELRTAKDIKPAKRSSKLKIIT